MESFYQRADYRKAKDKVLAALEKFEGINSNDTILDEIMMASYEMAALIKKAHGFVPEKKVPTYTINAAVKEVLYQLDEGTIREEAAALEILSRIAYEQLMRQEIFG